MGIVDTHTHLESFHRKGILDNAYAAATNAGVDRMITVGTGLDDWELYRELNRSRPGVVDYTVGIHPCSVDEDWRSASEQIEAFWGEGLSPVAVGEIGLDRFHLPKDKSEAEMIFNRQREAFARQLEIAGNLNAPVVIHSRGAFDECVEVIDESGFEWSRVVFHCFSEGPEEMQRLMDRGGYGSFTGIITFKNAELLREAALRQGLDRLMIETDAPYLAPMPHRGKPNEPAYLRHTAAYCANLFQVSEELFDEQTTANAAAFYGLR